jgi:(p)ppGpp synthase/HD superfamily hydrolase
MSHEGGQKSLLTERFEDAFIFATRLHARQLRKNSQVPYISHLMGVASLVLEDGGDEDEAIAALLHDAVEDQGGLRILKEIRERYGERVAEIVMAVTDSYEKPKPPWRERKKAYIASLRGAEPSGIRVSLADKVYNARATLMDIRREGESGWSRFTGGKEGTLWYYNELIKVFQARSSSRLLEEFTNVVRELERISGGCNGDREYKNNL